jgi:hypothetical protein
MTENSETNHATKKLIIKLNTHSYCTRSKARSLPWILVIVLPKVENCWEVPHQWEHKSKQKASEKRRIHEKRMGTQIQARGSSKKKHPWVRAIREKKGSNTHENHPIPQPKQGRGLSNIPSWASSASLMGTYSSSIWIMASVECPVFNKTTQATCLDKFFKGLKNNNMH